MEEGKDPLSQSLPTWSLKNMKKEPSVKCVYDSRLFNNKNELQDDAEYLKSVRENEENMKKGNNNKAFKDFLNASFSQPATSADKKANSSNKVIDTFVPILNI